MPDHQVLVAGEFQPGGDSPVVVGRGDEDLVAGAKPRPAVRDSVKSSEVMFGPKITSSGWQPRNRAAFASASLEISLTRRLVAYTAPRFALASRSAAAIASPTSSGTWEPPGASRNAKPCRSDEKRARIAATSMVAPGLPAISRFLPAGAPAGSAAPIHLTRTHDWLTKLEPVSLAQARSAMV